MEPGWMRRHARINHGVKHWGNLVFLPSKTPAGWQKTILNFVEFWIRIGTQEHFQDFSSTLPFEPWITSLKEEQHWCAKDLMLQEAKLKAKGPAEGSMWSSRDKATVADQIAGRDTHSQKVFLPLRWRMAQRNTKTRISPHERTVLFPTHVNNCFRISQASEFNHFELKVTILTLCDEEFDYLQDYTNLHCVTSGSPIRLGSKQSLEMMPPGEYSRHLNVKNRLVKVLITFSSITYRSHWSCF